MNNNTTQLSISTEVIEKIAETAVKEIPGVVGLSKKSMDLKSAVKNVKASKAFKGVKVESVNGALKINVYITVEKDTVVNEIAEKVQENVKEKIQNMTRTAVTKVNVTVADVKLGNTTTPKK